MTSAWKSSISSQWERKEVYSKMKYHVNIAGVLGRVGVDHSVDSVSLVLAFIIFHYSFAD